MEKYILGDMLEVANLCIISSYTDMRKSIDGLDTIVEQSINLYSFDNILFLGQ